MPHIRLFCLVLLSLVASCESCRSQPPASDAWVPQAIAEKDATRPDDFESILTGHRNLIYRGDLDEIKKRKVIRVITRNNSTSYFLFRGDEVGFEYELALRLAKDLGVRLEVVVAPTRRDMIPLLLQGKGDFIAAGMALTTARSERVVFSRPYMSVRNQVVVRKGRSPVLSKPEDLLEEMVHVRRNSSYFKRLRALGEQLGKTVPIAASPESMEEEDIIDLVAKGEIPVTLAKSNFLAAELTWRDDIEAAFALDGEEQIAWAMRPEDTKLKTAVDAFFKEHDRDVFFNSLYNKYFRNPKRAKILREEEDRADLGGAISPYDVLLKDSAKKYSLDWRLLAAQMYQESRFDPKAKSWAGAVGLMQIMPSTAAELGLTDSSDPVQSIEGGARYLRKMIDSFPETLPLKERIRFALASYNAGKGHVDDARMLTERQGNNADKWFGHTEKAMLLLSRPRFYTKAKHGYCRGAEPVNYVSKIQTRFDAYAAVAPAE